MGEKPPPVALVRGLGLLDATLLIVGSVIGSGIFFAPSIMAGYLQSPGLLLGLWVVGGLLTLAGALSYAELAAAMPRAGGQYVFLSEAFSPLFGFLYGWTLLLAINTGFVAAVAVAFAKTLGFFLPGVGEEHVLFSTLGATFTTAQLVALAVIAVLTWLNVTGLRTGAAVQNLFTIAKLSALGALVVLAVVTAKGSAANFRPLAGLALGPAGLRVGLFAALAGAMSKALFSYDSWYTVTFAAEEVKDPERNLPRSLIAGTLGITVAYAATVGVYLYMVPIGEMAAVTENRIGTEAAVRMIGPAGGAFIAVAILLSTFGCVNGLTLAGARVVFAMARDGLFFRGAARCPPPAPHPGDGPPAARPRRRRPHPHRDLQRPADDDRVYVAAVQRPHGRRALRPPAEAPRPPPPVPRLGLSGRATALRRGSPLLPRLHAGRGPAEHGAGPPAHCRGCARLPVLATAPVSHTIL